MSDKLDNAHAEIANALGELEKLFTPEMKLTFIARHPTNAECHVLVTNDDLTGLLELLTAEEKTK